MPSSTIGPGRDRAHLYVGRGRVDAQLSLGLVAWIKSNIPQIGCEAEGSLYIKPPIPWAWINNHDAHYNTIKYEQVAHAYIN